MNFLKNSSIYLTANLLNAAIPFLLLPILTRYLTVEEYGQIAMFQMLLSGLSTFIGLNSIGSATRKFYDDVSKQNLKIFNGTCFQLLIISSFLCVILALFSTNILSQFLSIPVDWIYIAIFISILTYITTFLLTQWQINNQAKNFGILQVSGSLINMLLSLQLVILLKEGASGRVNAQLISVLIIAFLSIIILYRKKIINIFTFNMSYLKEALSYGIPLIPHHIGIFLISAVDRFFINKEMGLEKAGIYMVAMQLSSALAILFDAINKAYVPWLFNKLKKNNIEDKIKIVKYTYFYFILLIICAIFAFFISPYFLIFIAGDKYTESASLIGWLCIGQIFSGMYLMVTNYLFFSKKTGRLALTTITTGIINIILLLILIPYLGLLGAAYAFIISKFIQFIFTWIISYYSLKMPWLIKEV
ncbi:oligosaccharide flippase family protein [Providencia stuartii]|uniref:oligosaccharide flippase family protein n=2 Tax=Providencia stuartii TaxID=588 RepID=UPI0028861D5C|nr:oligosaccharide flippase family protein [Providencia stuartii]MDT1068047.1 oligosaccharide flippase family protein [Providencia stuartii]